MIGYIFRIGYNSIKKALEMPKTKIIKPSEDAIEMMTQREQLSYSGAYETAK